MIKTTLKRSFIIIISVLQVLSFSRLSYAADLLADPNTASATAVAPTPADSIAAIPVVPVPATVTPVPTPATNIQGPSSPPGPENRSYHFNSGTGLWENDYYTWNPVTKKTSPKTDTMYSYNPETKRWDTTDWRYDAPAGKYVPNLISSSVAPSGVQPNIPAGDITSADQHSPLALAESGPSSSNTLNGHVVNSGTYDLFYNADISNNIDSTARSGDATVARNTLGGNAGTGDASAMATILNLLQSVWSPASGNIASFTANIDGDVFGDLTIDPGSIPQKLAINNDMVNKLNINADSKTAINNNIDLSATSGNANLTGNTLAGDAATGTANAVANVVNMLNSMIGSGQSFVGTVNINGNLNGDILLPPEMINQLLQSNVPRGTLDLSKVGNSQVLAQFTDNTSITNNVNADAASGMATADSNTKVGNVGSGNANTNVTILNLTGRQIIGSNALLVFVNVLGEWVGMIMDAPAGSTSAVVGGGITSDTAGSLDALINANADTAITNNINLAALSGNASATRNTRAGNVKTGDATASANIANVSNSNLSLSDWFGILFINVFGSWHGSFGVNTSAGDKPVAATAGTLAPDVQVFRFTESAGTHSVVPVAVTGNLGTANNSDGQSAQHRVLGASRSTTGSGPIASTVTPVLKKVGFGKLITLVSLSSLMFLGSETLVTSRKRRGLRGKFVEPFSKHA